MSTFKYDPLERNPNRPSIRLAVLSLGRRDDPIKITLIHDSFANKPIYECVSYTWGSTSAAKDIEINGTSVPVRRNLEKALRHFRRKDEDRMLWIDAICINQADDKEKSWQVTLMADIYRRAQRVLVWLGIIDAIEHPRPKNSSRGVGFRLTPKVPERETKTQEEKGREEEEYHRALCQKPYWKRVWIVQEIGVAADLELHWDLRPRGAKKLNQLIAKSESWDRFFDETRPSGKLANRATELAKQRVGRHGDAFLLANLIEAGADALCELAHDKIYGFVAIAHDCEDGSFPVDYSKPLWKLYEDFVKFQYKSTKDVAAKSIVHFSHVVLQVLKDVNAPETSWIAPMNPWRCETCYGHVEDGSRLIKITAMFAGDVSILGPSYDDLTGNPRLRRDWNLKLRECDADPSRLREESETFISQILALDASELRKAAANIQSFGWRFYYNGTSSRTSRICHPRSVPVETGFGESGLRLFATTEGTIGLIPSYVRKGDMLYRFWNSEVVAVVRAENNDAWRIVGKGLLATQEHIGDLDFDLVELENVSGLYLDTVALYKLTR